MNCKRRGAENRQPARHGAVTGGAADRGGWFARDSRRTAEYGPAELSAGFGCKSFACKIRPMNSTRYVRWQDGDQWLGYFGQFPDYRTQGSTPGDPQENLRDLYRDLTDGQIPGIREVAQLSIG